ncbi:DMT family transporter [Qipengyuania pelagi]|jgi:drug/metabolite transporter (DMT)-like permease|uniref:EamA family transporter n=1 Tax=Qipengyuania pelagi TaxID=994320 RepID=A0A844YB57_9SPHN|nr:DMT family transporter [Qipengyuania pelagi]MXO54192.1 EamA family transporter [Qipengyuania pelagi]
MGQTSDAADKNAFQPGAWHFVALIGGNVALALGPWLVRLADTGPVSAGFWRLLLPIPLIALFAWRERARHRIDGRIALLAVVAGIFFALDLASWHLGIERTRLGNATLFGNAGSVILMVWGLIALRRAPTRREGLGIAAALAGAAILLGRSLEISTQSALGDLFCVFAGICYAFYLLPAQKARARVGQWSVLLLVCMTAAPLLLAIALLMGEPVWPQDWTPLVALAISSQIVGQGLLVYSLGHFSPLIIGLALLTQPAIAAAVGWFAFGETLGALDIVGMILVGTALLLARTAKANPAR